MINGGMSCAFMEKGNELTELDITEVVIVLNSDEAVKAFSRGGNVTVGGMSLTILTFFKISDLRGHC
jgi:lipid-binding SYLF domain-containing protein